MQYEPMEIEASSFERVRTEDKKWVGRFKVRVLRSPDGEMTPEQAVPVEFDYRQLRTSLNLLEERELSSEQLVDLGRVLALLLLPPGEEGSPSNVRGFFSDSLKLIGQEAGLRLRLRLPPELAAMPWEYMYVDRAGGGDGMDGFLALDPRVAIVRHEPLSAPAALPLVIGNIKVVVALASPIDLPVLDLAKERADLEEAFGELQGIESIFLEDAALDEVQAAIPGTGVFHFAGHGMFTEEMAAVPGTYSGTGGLALDDQFVEAEQLAINLRGNGVRLAMLGGCETGRRGTDGASVWGGIAPALVKGEVPAIVANQYKILDKCAIAFSKQFYQALAGGLSIERAVAAGRIGAYNADKEGRDWGVPVLYLRAADGRLFEGASDPAVRERARAAAEVDVSVRVREVARGGEVLGAKVREMLAGKLGVSVVVTGTVYGKVVGATFDRIGGGSTNVDMEVDTVGKDGSVTGAKIDFLG